MAWINPTTVATGDVLTAAKWNQDVVENTIVMPRGVMGYAQVTASQSGITTATNVTGLSVTFTAILNRYYKTTIYTFSAQQNTAAGYAEFLITDASNVQKQSGVIYQLAGVQSPLCVSVVETGLSGSVTRKARALTGAGSLLLAASATSPMFIVVEDIGAV
jgi:hypothetical protein